MSMLRNMWYLFTHGGIPCIFHEVTGLDCPGCGGTRAVKALLRGMPLTSFYYHPIVLYMAAIVLWFSVSYFLYWLTKKEKYRIFLEPKWVYIGVAILIVNFVVKNYFLIAKGIDLLERLPQV